MALRYYKNILLLSCFSLAVFLLLSEGVTRIVEYTSSIKLSVLDERNTVYEFSSELGWISKKNFKGDLHDIRDFSVATNSLGFRSPEIKEKQKPRMIFLGDSFVWGYNLNQEELFTTILQRHRPNWELINLGVSGYGTDQEFILLKKYLKAIQPDVVTLFYNPLTDPEDNSSSARYCGYFKPYMIYDESDKSLHVKGVPVRKGLRYLFSEAPGFLFNSSFLKLLLLRMLLFEQQHFQVIVPDPSLHILSQMNIFLKQQGIKFYVFMIEDLPLQERLVKEGVIVTTLPQVERFSDSGKHWSVNGNHEIAMFLKDNFLPIVND